MSKRDKRPTSHFVVQRKSDLRYLGDGSWHKDVSAATRYPAHYAAKRVARTFLPFGGWNIIGLGWTNPAAPVTMIPAVRSGHGEQDDTVGA